MRVVGAALAVCGALGLWAMAKAARAREAGPGVCSACVILTQTIGG